MNDILYVLLGIGMLMVGGEALIRGALGVAARLGVSPLLSGLVIVGFGTSMPELVVSVNAAHSGQTGIAVGNVVGSNIGNVLLVLGLCAVITPLSVTPLALRRDALLALAASLLFIALGAGGTLTRLDGGLLLAGLLFYILWAYLSERSGHAPPGAVYEAEAGELEIVPKSAAWSCGATVLGLGMLIAGSQVLLIGAVGIALDHGLSEAVVGLTLVAVGTSLPELSISIIAAFRRHADVAVGNVLGSNIFNVLGILGVSALLSPLDVVGRIAVFDRWVMLGASVLLPMLLLSGKRLNRWEGLLLLSGYIAYIGLTFTLFAGA